MGKECGSWRNWRHYQWQPPNLNYESISLNPDQLSVAYPTAYPKYANHCICSVPSSLTAAGFAMPDDSKVKSYCGDELQARFSCYPQQTPTRTEKAVSGKKLYVSPSGESVPHQRQFLVFDQSGNRTSLVFSSIGLPIQNPYSSNPKPIDANGSYLEPQVNIDTLVQESVRKASWYGLDEMHADNGSGGTGSEMHEDTEEINALLYSDEEEEDEEEETSTGHSPSEMTGCKKKEVNDDAEVASSVTPIKRKRIEDEHDPSLVDTASSVKELDREDDTQSSCMKGGVSVSSVGEDSAASKRLRSQRIRETVCLLRNIIPGGKGKDAILVLDEAIQYLKSMKAEF